MANNPVDLDATDWSRYPPERVEGLQSFYRNPSSEEDGDPTEAELKTLCLKLECRVDMTIDNVVYWALRKTKMTKYDEDEERFKQSMPKLLRAIQRKGMAKYESYQIANAAMCKQFLEWNAEWRKNELRRIRYLAKLRAICSTWTASDSSDMDSDDEMSFDNVSINTVINRYNSYIETESIDILGTVPDVASDEVVETLEEVNAQSFVPQFTSTQIDDDNIPVECKYVNVFDK